MVTHISSLAGPAVSQDMTAGIAGRVGTLSPRQTFDLSTSLTKTLPIRNCKTPQPRAFFWGRTNSLVISTMNKKGSLDWMSTSNHAYKVQTTYMYFFACIVCDMDSVKACAWFSSSQTESFVKIRLENTQINYNNIFCRCTSGYDTFKCKDIMVLKSPTQLAFCAVR